jgi:hypothetical protein
MPSGELRVRPPECVSEWAKPEWGQYKQRGEVLGMPIMVCGLLLLLLLLLLLW